MSAIFERSFTTASAAASRKLPARAKENSSVLRISKRSADRFIGLDGYRGIAAVLIVAYHCYQHVGSAWKHMYAASLIQAIPPNMDNIVTLFFILSGFIIFRSFAQAALNQQGPYSARGFVIRRLLRIVPLYYIVLVFVWVSRYYGRPDQWLDLMEHLTFTQIFDPKHIFWTLGPTWSLSIEFWFYLLIVCLGPLTYRICGQFHSRKSRTGVLVGITVVLILIGTVYKIWVSCIAQVPANIYPAYYTVPARLDNFALGMLLAVAMTAYDKQIVVRGYVPWLLRAIAAVLIGVACYYHESHPSDLYLYISYQTLWSVAMLLVIISTIVGSHQSVWERFLASRPIQFLGMISYGIFLWNEPLLIGLNDYLVYTSALLFPISTLAHIIITLCMSSVSYWLLEKPLSYLPYLLTKDGRLLSRYAKM